MRETHICTARSPARAKLLPSFIIVTFLRVSNTHVICQPLYPPGIFIRSTPFYFYRKDERVNERASRPKNDDAFLFRRNDSVLKGIWQEFSTR